MSLFTNKTLMITGGTGSFGNAVLKRFLDTNIKEIALARKGLIYEMPETNNREKKAFIELYLNKYGKSIEQQFLEQITNSDISNNYLRLKVLLDLLIHHGEHDNLNIVLDSFLSCPATDFYQNVLSVYENTFTRDLVSHCFSLLCFFRVTSVTTVFVSLYRFFQRIGDKEFINEKQPIFVDIVRVENEAGERVCVCNALPTHFGGQSPPFFSAFDRICSLFRRYGIIRILWVSERFSYGLRVS